MIPLSLKLNDVDTSMPQPVDGKYNATISSAEVKDNRLKTGYNLVVTVALTDSCTSTKGKEMKPGFKMTRFMPLPIPGSAYDNEHKEMFMTSLAMFQLAVLGLKNTEDNVARLPELDDPFIAGCVGKAVVVKVGLSKEKDGQESEFGPRQEIKAFLPVAE